MDWEEEANDLRSAFEVKRPKFSWFYPNILSAVVEKENRETWTWFVGDPSSKLTLQHCNLHDHCLWDFWQDFWEKFFCKWDMEEYIFLYKLFIILA